MISDKELADKVVALGVGSPKEFFGCDFYICPDDDENIGVYASSFVRDPRVAMALMEKMDGQFLIWLQKYSARTDVWIVEPEKQDADARNESLPRAIVEACVGALS